MVAGNEQMHIAQSIGDYFISSTIGHGSSGRVKLGIHQFTGQKVAIKIIPRSQLNSSIKITRAVERELAVLQLLHHPNLIDLHQVLQDENNVYFVTEYVSGGELYHVLTDKGKLPETEARNIFGQIASALSWCHTRSICHRDLKPENILLDTDRKNIKIADFGMATMQSANALLKTSCGSPHYASPEIIRGIPYYGPSADVWSAGVILYTLLTGKLPFDDRHVGRLLAKIKTGRFKKIPDWVSSSAKDLIYRILIVDPNERIGFNGILSHPWMVPYVSSSLSPTTTANTTMLSIHSFSLQHNPWHDDQLKNPLILKPCDLHGPTRETLKVLWRDLSHDQIVSALMETNPNLQKLTYQLLQQRLKRQFDLMERSTDSIEKKLDFNICDTTPTILLSSSSQQSPSSYSNYTESTACDDIIRTNDTNFTLKPLSSSRLAFDTNSSIISKNEKRYFSLSALPTVMPPQSQPNTKTKPIINLDLSIPQRLNQLLRLFPASSEQHFITSGYNINKIKIASAQATFLSSSPVTFSIEESKLESKLLSLLSDQKWTNIINRHYHHIYKHRRVIINAKNYIQDKYSHFLSALFKDNKTKKNKHMRRIVRQEFSIQCVAKSEFIAAGKLHHILSDHFDGRLNGCMYPDGKILWSGEIDIASLDIAEQNLSHNSKTCFLCKIRILPDNKSLYKLVFIIHREDPLLVSTFANRLLDLLVLYENESEVAMKTIDGFSS